MTKIYHLLFVCLGVINTYAQTPNQESLIGIHNISTLGDTSSINNPYQGSLIYVADIKTNYQYDGTKWELWYKSTAAPADTNTLTTLVDNISYSDTCCQFTHNLNVCGGIGSLYGYTVGEWAYCGLIVRIISWGSIDSMMLWIVAPDEYVDVTWGNYTQYPNYEYGVDVEQVTNDCPTCYNGARLCYEYQPEGCELDLDWQMAYDFWYIECYRNLLNSRLREVGGDLFYVGTDYWTGYEDNTPSVAHSYVLDADPWNGSFSDDSFKGEEKRVRPMLRVTLYPGDF